MDDAKAFWANVQSVIKFQDLRQELVAKNAGIRFGTFHGWISKSIFPRANEAVRIAAVLNTSVEALVSGSAASQKEAHSNAVYHISAIREHLKALEIQTLL